VNGISAFPETAAAVPGTPAQLQLASTAVH